MTKRKAPAKGSADTAARKRKAAPKPETTPEEILEPCTPLMRRIAEEVRSLVRHVVPTATERAYPGWHGIGFRDPQAGYVFGLFPHSDHIKLFFERGAELEDPDGVFQPADGLKQGRYIELRTVIDAKKPALRRMIIRAVVHQSV